MLEGDKKMKRTVAVIALAAFGCVGLSSGAALAANGEGVAKASYQQGNVSSKEYGGEPWGCQRRETGAMCLYSNVLLGNASQWFDNNTYLGDTWNDRAVAVKNNGKQCSVTVYKDVNYGGQSKTLAKGTSWSIQKFEWGHKTISSNKWC